MLIVICGEDTVAAFNYYSELKNKYKKDGYEVFDIEPSEIENILLWMNESVMLFANKKAFFTRNLNKKISKKQNLKINKIIEEIINNKNIELFDYEEEISSYYLKFSKKVTIKEFKLNENIFKLQESILPGNLKNFIHILNTLTQTQDEFFIFNMLTKHLRELILIKTEKIDKKIAPWKLSKLRYQAEKWELDKLLSFYDGLYKIDLQQKTSSTPYNIKKSLEILACYYL